MHSLKTVICNVAMITCLAGFAAAEPGPADAVDAFTRALASGDEAEAIAWLSPDLVVFESGHVESSREEYIARHLRSDIEFLSKVKVDRLARVGGAGNLDLAWVATRSRIRGRGADGAIDVISTETMVLRREPEGWRIRHIHWSSADAKD